MCGQISFFVLAVTSLKKEPMKRISKALTVFVLLALLVAQTACTANQVDEVIADLQIGVDAASVAVPLVLAAFAPAVAAPVSAYLAAANQVFAEVAKIAASAISNQQKAASIASTIATLVAQDPSQILPPNSPPQLIAEVAAVANAARAVAALFPPAGVPGQASLLAAARSPQLKLSAAQAARLKALQVQAEAQANQAALAARR
jgi:hypothetical protein